MSKGIKKKVSTILMIMAATVFSFNVSAAALPEGESENYGVDEIITTEADEILEEAVAQVTEQAGNNYPIVMVHGLGGWGNKEVLNEYYWGGDTSLKEMLNDEGYEVYTPTIGPVASNWDRACELYAYLKGGTVDYGKAHAEADGHSRYGRTFPGVLPDLGTMDEAGQLKKVHLMGHSMGGETIRVLAQLLEQGCEEEVAATGDETSDLFKGDQHWIESITTICTPHDGSQYDEIKAGEEPFIHRLVAGIAALEGGKDIDNVKLDLQLDQWGLKKQEGESQKDYIERVAGSKIWEDTHDLSIWDLSLEGAKELNTFAQAQDDIYYFSISCVDTHKDLITGYQFPNINMHPMLVKTGIVMGRYEQNEAGKVVVDEDWWRNDGIVSVRSAIAPHEGSLDQVVEYDGNPQQGVWNYLGEIKNIDHIEVVGQKEPIYKDYLQNKFRTWAAMLKGL